MYIGVHMVMQVYKGDCIKGILLEYYDGEVTLKIALLHVRVWVVRLLRLLALLLASLTSLPVRDTAGGRARVTPGGRVTPLT